jgi:dihydrofolate reductase
LSKVVLYIACSLDGFIAGKDGDVGWLDEYDGAEYGYQQFYESVEALIMGSRTYEQALSFGEWPYPNKKSYVITGRQLGAKPDPSIEFYSGDLTELVAAIKQTGRDIWLVGGSQLLASFWNEALIDEIRLFVIPTLLNEGIPLFRGISRQTSLTLVGSESYDNGVVQLHYSVQPKQ